MKLFLIAGEASGDKLGRADGGPEGSGAGDRL